MSPRKAASLKARLAAAESEARFEAERADAAMRGYDDELERRQEEARERLAAELDAATSRDLVGFATSELEAAEASKARRTKGLTASNERRRTAAAARRAKWEAEILAATPKTIGRLVQRHQERREAARLMSVKAGDEPEETRALVEKAGLGRSTIHAIRAKARRR